MCNFILGASHIYTAVWNLLDFPAGVIPFGQESGTKVDEVKLSNKNLEKLVKEVRISLFGCSSSAVVMTILNFVILLRI